MFLTGSCTGTSLIALGRGTNTWLSTGVVQQISPPAPACERVARMTVNTIGPTRGPANTRAVVITQFPRGVCDVHAPEMSLPSSVQLGGGGPVYTSASQPLLVLGGTFSGAPTVTACAAPGAANAERHQRRSPVSDPWSIKVHP